ncbi:MAG: nucleotide exchange factor GrpE [Bacteroidales bacterium]
MSRKTKHNAVEQEEQDNREPGMENENLTEAGENTQEPEKMSAGAASEPVATETSGENGGTVKGTGPEEQIAQWQDKYLRLSADFDNFRKRSMREKSELIRTAGEDILVALLPVVDDFERALKAMETAQDLEAVKQGITLIQGKFKEFLNQRGVKEIDALNQPFDLDFHEAVTKIPAPQEDLKGKNVDVLTKGYLLNDKVIRYAKVVIGE